MKQCRICGAEMSTLGTEICWRCSLGTRPAYKEDDPERWGALDGDVCKCEQCGEVFKRPHKYGPKPRFCSRRCMSAAYNRLPKERERRREYSTRRRRRYREDPEYRQRMLDANRRYREKHRRKRVPRTCAICGKKFVPRNKQARMCSEECRREHGRRYAREFYRKNYRARR